jgi:hypothetical protein
MRNRMLRSAVGIAGLLSAAGLAAGAQATDFSIDTTVPGGSAWVTNPPGYLGGYLNLADQNYTVNAYIGVIDLKGQLAHGTPGTLTDLKVFCIDIMDDLRNGVFTETTLSNIESDHGGLAHVLYTSAQVQNLFKFMVYADKQGITDSLTSAAAQLGAWEIISESGTNWNLSSGNFSVSMWGGQPDAVSLANSWLNASKTQSTVGYTLHALDPGQGNQMQAFVTHLPGDQIQLGVPEPATWGMIVVGFGLLGSALRRRKPEESFA